MEWNLHLDDTAESMSKAGFVALEKPADASVVSFDFSEKESSVSLSFLAYLRVNSEGNVKLEALLNEDLHEVNRSLIGLPKPNKWLLSMVVSTSLWWLVEYRLEILEVLLLSLSQLLLEPLALVPLTVVPDLIFKRLHFIILIFISDLFHVFEETVFPSQLDYKVFIFGVLLVHVS